MNFKEWSGLSLAAERTARNLVMERRWMLRERTEHIGRVYDRSLDTTRLVVNVQVYARDVEDGVIPVGGSARAGVHMRIDADNYGTIQNPFGELSGELLHFVARMRDTVQLWVDGKIDELPPSNVP